MKLEKLYQFFKFPYEKKFQTSIDIRLVEYLHHLERVACPIILGFQAFMMISISLRDGGPFVRPRRTGYFVMYAALIICTLAYMTVSKMMQRQKKSASACLSAEAIYVALICLWGCIISLLDQLGGNDISVFAYMLLSVAAFSIVSPLQGFLIFGGSFLFFNLCLPLFFTVERNMFSYRINTLFIVSIAYMISLNCNRNRIHNYYDQIVIEKQYEEIYQINEQLNRLAMTDALTQMNNRRDLETIIRKRMQDCRAGQQSIAGMMIDVDFFKQYNDFYGHSEGDKCLQNIANILLDFVEWERAYAVRYGGEEFFICLFGYSEETALEKTEALRRKIEKRNFIRKDLPVGRITVSIGLCYMPDLDEASVEELIRRSDTALYQAKNSGRNQTCIYKPGGEIYNPAE